MPVFECSRCNNLTYSASRFASLECDVCHGERHRVLDHAFSFEDARAQPREIAQGDHCCLAYDDPAAVAPLLTALIRRGLADGALVIAYPPGGVRSLVEEALTPDELDLVAWQEPSSVYGDGFDAEEVVERFRVIAEAEDRPVYIVGGADRPLSDFATPAEYARFERRATELGSRLGIVVVCLYDRSIQPEPMLGVGATCHPLAAAGGALRRNEDFVYRVA